MVNIGSLATGGRVVAVKADLAKIALAQPVCTEVREKIALSRRVDKHWRCVFVCRCALSMLVISFSFLRNFYMTLYTCAYYVQILSINLS